MILFSSYCAAARTVILHKRLRRLIRCSPHFGTMKNSGLALLAVAANGAIVCAPTRAKKASTGYDPPRLFTSPAISSSSRRGWAGEVSC